MIKGAPANGGEVRDVGLILGQGRSPREGNGNALHYSCLQNPMDRRAWQATVHGAVKSDTTDQLSNRNDRQFCCSLSLE